jgi:hypothetical protein
LSLAFDPHLFLFKLDGEAIFLNWDQLQRGACDAIDRVDSHLAHVVLTGETEDEWSRKTVEMLKAII